MPARSHGHLEVQVAIVATLDEMARGGAQVVRLVIGGARRFSGPYDEISRRDRVVAGRIGWWQLVAPSPHKLQGQADWARVVARAARIDRGTVLHFRPDAIGAFLDDVVETALGGLGVTGGGRQPGDQGVVGRRHDAEAEGRVVDAVAAVRVQ